MWYWQKDTHINQWNRIENGDTESHKYGHLIFDRGPNGESKLFQQIVLEKLVSHIQKILIDINLLSYTEINSKWIIDLAIKHKAIIHLEENKRKNLYVLRLGEEFLEMAPKSLSIKKKGWETGLHQN